MSAMETMSMITSGAALDPLRFPVWHPLERITVRVNSETILILEVAIPPGDMRETFWAVYRKFLRTAPEFIGGKTECSTEAARQHALEYALFWRSTKERAD